MKISSPVFFGFVSSILLLLLLLGGGNDSIVTDATLIPAGVAGNWSLLGLQVLLDNETICGSVYTGNNRVWFGIQVAANQSAGAIVEVDTTTMTKTRSFYGFVRKNPCTLITDGFNLYVGTNTDPAEIVFLRLGAPGNTNTPTVFFQDSSSTFTSTRGRIQCGALKVSAAEKIVVFGTYGSGSSSYLLGFDANTGSWIYQRFYSGFYDMKSLHVVSKYGFLLLTSGGSAYMIRVDMNTLQDSLSPMYMSSFRPAAGFVDGDYYYVAIQTTSNYNFGRYRITSTSFLTPLSYTSSSGSGAACVAAGVPIAYNGRNAFHGLGANPFNSACVNGFAMTAPTFGIPELSSSTDGFADTYEAVKTTFIDNENLAYYIFAKRNSGPFVYNQTSGASYMITNVTSYVIGTPQKLVRTNYIPVIRSLTGMNLQVQGTQESWTAAATRCSQIKNADGEPAFLAMLNSRDAQRMHRHASGDWQKTYLGSTGPALTSTSSTWYWNWNQGPSYLQESNYMSFYDPSGNQDYSGTYPCAYKSFCSFHSFFASGYGSCLMGLRQSGKWIQTGCDDNVTAGLCQWENSNVSSLLSNSGENDRFFTITSVARGTTATPPPPALDAMTNKRYEWNSAQRRFDIFPFLHSTEVNQYIYFSSCGTTVNYAKILLSNTMFVVCGSKLYQIILATSASEFINDYSILRATTPLELVRDLNLVIIYGAYQTDIYSLDRSTKQRTLAWTSSSGCTSISFNAALKRMTAWCGNSVTVSKYFQDPTTGRLTVYQTINQPTSFNTTAARAFATSSKFPSSATVVVTQESIPEIPIAFDSPGISSSTFCNSVCKDLAFLNTFSCTPTLITLTGSNVTAVVINSDGSSVNLGLTNRIASIACTGGSSYTPSTRYDSLSEYLVTVAGLQKNASGVRPIWVGGNSPSITVQRVVSWESPRDSNLVGFAVSFSIRYCSFATRSETWFQSNDHLYPNLGISQNPSPTSDDDIDCNMHMIFYYNVSVPTTGLAASNYIVGLSAYGGSYENAMPHNVVNFGSLSSSSSSMMEGLLNSRISIQRRATPVTPSTGDYIQDNLIVDFRNAFYPMTDSSPLYSVAPVGLSNGSLSLSTFTVVTDNNLHILRRPLLTNIPNVPEEYALRLDTPDVGEDFNVLRCSSPAAGQLFFKNSKSFPQYGYVTPDTVTGITAKFEPDLGSGGYFSASTNSFAITSVPCPYVSATETASRIDLVLTFPGNTATPLRIPFIVLPVGAPVPSDLPPLPMTTATATPAPTAPTVNTIQPIVSVPEYPNTTSTATAIAGVPDASTFAQVAALLAAQPAAVAPATYTVSYTLRSPLLGTLQLNTSLWDKYGITSSNATLSEPYNDRATLSSTNPIALASIISGGFAALATTPDVTTLNLLPKRYLSLQIVSPSGGTSTVNLPLTLLLSNSGPMVYNNSTQCQNIPFPQGRIWYNFTFGAPLFYHPNFMRMNITMQVLDGLLALPSTLRVNIFNYPEYKSNGTGTYDSNVDLRVQFTATDGKMTNSVICNLKPYWVDLHVLNPVAASIRLKAMTAFSYSIPLDIFESSAAEIRYTSVFDGTMITPSTAWTSAASNMIVTKNVIFDNPNTLRGSFPEIGNYTFVVQAADLFAVKTSVINFQVGNVAPVVGQVLPFPDLQALRYFNVTLPVPCTDPDYDALLVQVVRAPPSWVSYTISPGQRTTQAQSIFLSGFVPASALAQRFSFDVQCSDYFASVSYTQTFQVLGSVAPELVQKLPNYTVTVGTQFKGELNGWTYFSDPDNDPFSLQVYVPAQYASWITYTIITPTGIDATTNAQNNQRLQIVVNPPYDDWKVDNADQKIFNITIWAVDEFGVASNQYFILIEVDYTAWMRAAPTAVPIIAIASTLLFIAFIVCCYPCFLNHLYKRRTSTIECPLKFPAAPTYVFPEGTAKFEIYVRRTGCVWPIWIFSDYLYDQWTLKTMPIGRPPAWLDVNDESVSVVPGSGIAKQTAEVVVRCFSGGGLILSQFTANYNSIMNNNNNTTNTHAPTSSDHNKYSEEMHEKALLPHQQQQPPQIVVSDGNNGHFHNNNNNNNNNNGFSSRHEETPLYEPPVQQRQAPAPVLPIQQQKQVEETLDLEDEFL